MVPAVTRTVSMVTFHLGRLKVHLIVTWTTPAAFAAKRATSRIPIVAMTGDPVGT
jgi:ABC-type uncharacterized transport system substrate-binding protein